jgi:photosystem II stability/assembly factor-like uncharacterized protein
MKILRIAFVFASLAVAAQAQWIKQGVDTTASFRGLSVVNENVVWASGTGGTVVKTTDGGKTWSVTNVPGAEKLDFRDIEAFDGKTAYILSIGNGDNSRIYKTVDGGATWKPQFTNHDEKAFYDAIACWDEEHCVAMSDPIDNRYRLLHTVNGGAEWTLLSSFLPVAKQGEAAFAASGTCLIVRGGSDLFIVSGGNDARVFMSDSRGMTAWKTFTTPITKGTPGSGIFSIAMRDGGNGVIVGGNYEKPDETKDNLAFTTDGGATWKLGTGLTGYRSGVAYIGSKSIIAVGTNGTDLTTDGGKTWKKIGDENLNAVAADGKKAVWAVGPKGLVVKLK